MAPASLEIIAKEEKFHIHVFRGSTVTFRVTKFNGQLSEPTTHFVLDRGDSVAVLLHDLVTDEVVLVEQFRIATYENGPGWMLEIPAGRIDDGETPSAAALRETKEETGTDGAELELVSSFYLSPGGLSERLHLFYCPFPNGLTIDGHGGLAHEGEDLRVHRLSVQEAFDKIGRGEIIDAKTIVALLWLANRQLTGEGSCPPRSNRE